MSAVTFDTHDFIKELESSGFTEEQAEALARAQKRVNEANLSELSTKGDLRELELRIEGRLNLLTWMLALVIVTTVVPALKSLFS